MELGAGGSADLDFAAVPRLGLFSPRRKALTLLERHMACPARPNVRAKRAAAVGRQARDAENVQRTCFAGLVACRWRSA